MSFLSRHRAIAAERVSRQRINDKFLSRYTDSINGNLVGAMTAVLIVDEDAAVVRAWRRLVSLEGYTVETATDGLAALAAAVAAKPALLIAGQSMPYMGGVELCRRLRVSEEFSSVRLILTSADLFPLAIGAVCDDFWEKPVPAEPIRSSIQRLLCSGERSRAMLPRGGD
ncbi:response regulator [Paraburkholderia hospita]|uniref:response regulator n=1 Tax=Paraburkholderia hospita TaxID=169430 RepID=UPI000B34306A|nr:response regulator [Paraburkholderia hospita]OUL75738.1 hypothetical protein CA601_41700 [Paraburkholderia hospita]